MGVSFIFRQEPVLKFHVSWNYLDNLAELTRINKKHRFDPL